MGEISFSQIPSNWMIPLVWAEFNSDNAVSGPSVQPMKILAIGQKLAAGTAETLKPYRITRADEGKKLFGPGSMLAETVRAVKEANGVTDLYAAAMDDDNSGTAATASLTFTGAASESGTVFLYIGDQRVKAGVASGHEPADMASAVAAAVNAGPDLPVTAQAAEGAVTLTAKHKGECGNMPVSINHYADETLPAGVSLAVTDLTGGKTNPDIDDVFAAIGETHFNFIIMPYTDGANLAALKAEMASRWGALRAIEGMAFGAFGGTFSEIGEKVSALNDPHLTIMQAHGLKSPAYRVAGAYAGITALYTSNDPAAPFRYALPGILAGAEEEQFTNEENNLLIWDGASTFSLNAAGEPVIQTAVTTYKKNDAGADDTAYQDVNTPILLGYLRYDWRNHIARKFPNWKLGDDGAKGAKVMTPKKMKAEAIAWFKTHAENGLVENVDAFKKAMIVERDASNKNRLNVMLPPDLMNQLNIVATQVAFIK